MSELDAVRALGRILESLGVDWVLIGALAANRYRLTTRTTQDVDLLLLREQVRAEQIESALRAAGWSVRRATADGALLRASHPTHGLADLITAGTDYERTAIERARSEPSEAGPPVRVLAPEDVIVFKLIAGRAQDLADVEAILAAKPALDESYLESWANAWDVIDAWRRLRDAARS